MNEPQQSRSRADALFPVGTLSPPGTVFVGAHHGAGTSIWARLLEGSDAGLTMPGAGRVIGVCRSTPAGIGAAKTLIRAHGRGRFHLFMVVADAPGRLPVRVRRDIRILSGAVTVLPVPWMARLRGAQVTDPLAPAAASRPVSRIRRQLAGTLTAVPGPVAQEALNQRTKEQ